ncbi:apolipoprotein N-acyltransferase [Sphingobium sufflavum]|uniref:apolipoprotein N-acyltransferase n=1 Tax=Sphingobium sufflavum TaxID=1129547 RepID=UPI001F2D98E9|nr:apolipoprotein N-acyltransferase [Sphingobium sufflavum]MCE7797660.1 apolipoprotein N-acyltransferase [Sphingobium sufflavum]
MTSARLPAWVEGRPFPIMLVAGALSATGFAPLGLWPVTLLSLALLLALLDRARTGRKAFALGYAYGLGQFVVGLNWIAYSFTFQDAMPHWFGYLGVVLLSVYLAVYPAAATLLAWRCARGAGPRGGGAMALTLVLAGGWALTEYLRATLFTGFAWNPLGVIWLGTGVDHMARLIGTYGLATVAIMAGGALWMFLRGQRKLALLFALKLLAVVALGWLHSHWTRPGPAAQPVMVQVVQPNIPQDEKYDPLAESRNFLKLAKLSGAPSPTPRLLFWPEAAISALLDMEPDWRARLAALLGPGDVLMTGGDKFYFRKTTSAFYAQGDLMGANNSLWVLTPEGRIAGRYDKAHLVPYGEYLPMRPLLSAIGLSRLVPGDVDFWPGPGPRTLALPAGASGGRTRLPLKMGVQICYEIIFSGQVVERANRPDFLFNPSNDAWFGRWGPPQHLAQARLRAVEEAMPVIRSTPTGISAIIDASGRVTAAMGPHQASALQTVLPPAAPATLFARFGNMLPMILALALIVSGVALARVRR